MSRSGPAQRLLPSILDRLLGDCDVWTVESVRAAVKRDLEWLLNSRRMVSKHPSGSEPLGQSLVTYGLPDLGSFRPGVGGDEEQLRLAMQEAIRRFEPRLSRVRVMLDAGATLDRSVRFRIDALLRVEPEPEHVAFDSVLRLDDQTFEIREQSP
jgi:type VI secretion system protein ImpF